jgi:hypothetical protein
VGLTVVMGHRRGGGTRFGRWCSPLAGSGDGRLWSRRGPATSVWRWGGGREGCPKSKRGVKLTEGGGILVEIRRGDDELWRPVCQAVVEKYEGGSSTASTRRKLTWGEEHDDGTRSDFFG